MGREDMDEASESEFVRLLTEAQPRLFAYISMLLGGTQEAGNVLQETNLVLWRKAADYEPGTSFLAWAREVAYFKTLSFLRDQKRSKVLVDQERINAALAPAAASADADERRTALRHCLANLAEDQVHLLRMRYTGEVPLREIASRLEKSEAAVKMALRRIRLRLMSCIQHRLRVADV